MKDIEFDLYQKIKTEHTIKCSTCNKKEKSCLSNKTDATMYFFDTGWRVVNDKVLCKKCFKKAGYITIKLDRDFNEKF